MTAALVAAVPCFVEPPPAAPTAAVPTPANAALTPTAPTAKAPGVPCGFRIKGRGRGGLTRMTAVAAEGYEDNKRRSVLAVQRLLPDGHEVLTHAGDKGVKKDDLCDVLLMALWELWQTTSWTLPRKGVAPRRKAVPAAVP